jgi:hypothetical protein
MGFDRKLEKPLTEGLWLFYYIYKHDKTAIYLLITSSV